MSRRTKAKPVTAKGRLSLDALPAAIALTLIAGLPAFLNLNSHQIFEEQKSLLLAAGAAMALPGLAFSWRRLAGIARDPVVLLFVGFVAVLFVASIGQDFSRAFWGAYQRRHGLVMWVALATLFVAMCDAARGEAMRQRLILAIVIGTIWPSLMVIVQRLGGDPMAWLGNANNLDAGGGFGNPILFGGYLAVAIPLTAMLALRGHRLVGVFLLLQVTALFAAGSRGALVAAVASGVAFLAAWGVRRLTPRMLGLGAATIAIPILLLILVPSLRPVQLSDRLNLSGGTVRVRVVIWRDIVNLLQSSGGRLLIGHGPESLARMIGPHYSSELTNIEGSDAMPDRAHNETLDTLVNGGVIGLSMQLAMFALAFWRLRLIDEPWLRAGLIAALVAHIVEIQFGIATVASRMAALAIVAISVGLAHDDTPDNWLTRGERLFVPAVAAALSPWFSTLPARSSALPSSGTAADFIAYLDQLAAGTTVLYVAMFLSAAFMAWTIARPGRTQWFWAKAVALVVAAAAVVPLSLTPTWADSVTAAGASYEAGGQLPEALIAYREAVNRLPDVSYYRAGVGRVLINLAVTRPPQEREPLLTEAEVNYRIALTAEPFDPDHARHLAGLLRVQAMSKDEQAREKLLEDADRVYAEVTSRVPALPSLWIEWAYLDLDRGQRETAAGKLGRAQALGGNKVDQEKMADLSRRMAQ